MDEKPSIPGMDSLESVPVPQASPMPAIPPVPTTPPQTTNPGTSSCDKAPSLSLSISNAQENVWTNKDVIININSTSNCGASVDLKYALDCSSGCNYTIISGKSVTISNSGIHKVTILAKDSKNNKETSSIVTLKIDKTPPVLTLLPDGGTSFTPKAANTKKVRVCAKVLIMKVAAQKRKYVKIIVQVLLIHYLLQILRVILVHQKYIR